MNGNIKKAVLFIVLTFFFSWLLAAVFYALGGRLNTGAAFVVLAAVNAAVFIYERVGAREPVILAQAH